MDVSTQCSIIRLGDAAHHVLFSKGRMRFIVVGWISAVVNLATFAAPLSIIIVRNSWIIVLHALSLYNFSEYNQWSGEFYFFSYVAEACDRNKKCKSTCPSMSFLTICSTMWFFYGIFVRDFFIAVTFSLIMEYGLFVSFPCAQNQSWYRWISRYLMWWDLYLG